MGKAGNLIRLRFWKAPLLKTGWRVKACTSKELLREIHTNTKASGREVDETGEASRKLRHSDTMASLLTTRDKEKGHFSRYCRQLNTASCLQTTRG